MIAFYFGKLSSAFINQMI